MVIGLFAFAVFFILPATLAMWVMFKIAAAVQKRRARKRLNRAYRACQSPPVAKPDPVMIVWPIEAPKPAIAVLREPKPRQRRVGFGLLLACVALIVIGFFAAASMSLPAHSAIPQPAAPVFSGRTVIVNVAPRARAVIVLARDDTQRALDAQERRHEREHELYIDRTARQDAREAERAERREQSPSRRH